MNVRKDLLYLSGYKPKKNNTEMNSVNFKDLHLGPYRVKTIHISWVTSTFVRVPLMLKGAQEILKNILLS